MTNTYQRSNVVCEIKQEFPGNMSHHFKMFPCDYTDEDFEEINTQARERWK